LRACTSSGGGSPNKEFEYAYEIDEALSEARAAMARGYCSDAVDALTKVEPFLSYGNIQRIKVIFPSFLFWQRN
jgi:hypothetical protein